MQTASQQESLFTVSAPSNSTKLIKVSGMSLEGTEDASTLFDGFTNLKCITWSYGLEFLVSQMRKFATCELVFGCNAMVDAQVQASALRPLIVQGEMLKTLQNKLGREISDRVDAGTCTLFFENTTSSHQKIYLLKNEQTGASRVILGSANFSQTAWRGNKQKEVLIYSDTAQDYELVLNNLYLPFRDTCANMVPNLKASLDKLDATGTLEPEDIPIMQTNNKIVVLESAPEDVAQAEITMADCALYGGLANGLNKEVEALLPKAYNGKMLLDANTIQTLTLKGRELQEANALINKESPRLVIHDGIVSLNGKTQSREGWQTCLLYLVEFLNGFKEFQGNTSEYQREAWRFVVWFFASPWFWKIRRAAQIKNQQGCIMALPMYGFLIGGSNAGKTSLVRMLIKCMCGLDLTPISGKDFKAGAAPTAKTDKTTGKSKSLKPTVLRRPSLMQINQKGIPLLYDDVPRQTDSNLRSILTNPQIGQLDKEVDGWPACVCTTNLEPPMPQEFQKRCLFFFATANLNQSRAIELGGLPSSLIKKADSSLFAELAGRVDGNFAQMAEACTNVDPYLLVSSTLCKMLAEANIKAPWASTLHCSDYFSEEVLAKRAKATLQRYLLSDVTAFERDKFKNRLICRCKKDDKVSSMELQNVATMLPPRLGAEWSSGLFTAKLKETEAFCGRKFKKENWFEKHGFA